MVAGAGAKRNCFELRKKKKRMPLPVFFAGRTLSGTFSCVPRVQSSWRLKILSRKKIGGHGGGGSVQLTVNRADLSSILEGFASGPLEIYILYQSLSTENCG